MAGPERFELPTAGFEDQNSSAELRTVLNTCMYIEYIDYPEIPKELLLTTQAISNLPNTDTPSNFSHFKTKEVNSELRDWLETTFQFNFGCQYQIISPGIPIHTDIGRNVVYNYIIEPGGTEVRTVVYGSKNKDDIIQSEIIQSNRWHRLEVAHYHSVENINPDSLRFAVSVIPRIASELKPLYRT